MTKHLAGLIKLPCRAVKADTMFYDIFDILDDRGLRFATVRDAEIAAAIVVALNHPNAPTDFDYAPHEATK